MDFFQDLFSRIEGYKANKKRGTTVRIFTAPIAEAIIREVNKKGRPYSIVIEGYGRDLFLKSILFKHQIPHQVTIVNRGVAIFEFTW